MPKPPKKPPVIRKEKDLSKQLDKVIQLNSLAPPPISPPAPPPPEEPSEDPIIVQTTNQNIVIAESTTNQSDSSDDSTLDKPEPTLTEIRSNRGNKDYKRNRQPKPDPTQPNLEAIEVRASLSPFPFVTDRIRVGIGGDNLTLGLINDDEPITFRNIADGEIFNVRADLLLKTDCANVVIMK